MASVTPESVNDLKELYMKEVQRVLDGGKAKDYAENAAFNAPVCRGRLRRTYLERLKWIHCIVMKSIE